MRFQFVLSLLVSMIALAACAGPAPNLATPARPPIVVPTQGPARPTAQPTAGLVTATPEPVNAVPTATEAPQGGATAAAPAATDVPVAPVQADTKLVGTYSGILPAADAIGRVVTLELALDGSANLMTQFIGKGEPILESGTWVGEGETASAIFTQRNGQPEDNRIAWELQGTNLVSTVYDKAQYGDAGVPLARVGTGDIIEANYAGVSFSFDAALAKAAQGKMLPPVPVTQAPALGGGAPQAIQFTFDNQTLPDYFDPNQSQVYVYPLDSLKALDPSVATNVESLQKILADGTVDADAQIPVFPFMPASQVFHSKAQIIDFVNGTGVSFITYYAQDVSPIRSAQVFWTFQGITLDEKYYVSVFWHIGSPALPEPEDISGAEYDAFVKQYQDYINNLVVTLNGLPPAGFIPNLSLLENMVRSINASPNFVAVAPEAATPAPQATVASAEAQMTPAPQQPGAAGQPTATSVSASSQPLSAEHAGASITVDSALAHQVTGVTVPVTAIDPNVPGGLGMGGPEHIAFEFNGRPLTGEVSPFEPQVRIYPTDGLQALDPAVAREILALKTLLQAKPATIPETAPVLPLFNAQQVLHPQLKYLPFKNGEGVRMVTFYAQNPSPITNDGLFYTYQGLSADGKYYVMAFFPVRTDKLANTYQDAGITDFDAWVKGYSKYLDETNALLNGLGPEAFQPNLALLDRMIQSIQAP